MTITDNAQDDWDYDEDDDEDEETIDCPECGKTVYLIADKCPQCGHWFLEEEKAGLAFRSRTSADLKNPAKLALVVIVLLVILSLLVPLFIR